MYIEDWSAKTLRDPKCFLIKFCKGGINCRCETCLSATQQTAGSGYVIFIPWVVRLYKEIIHTLKLVYNLTSMWKNMV